MVCATVSCSGCACGIFFRAPVHGHVVGNVQVVLCAVKPQGFAALLCTCAMQLHQLRLSFTCLLYVTNQPG